jgi:integrase
MALTVKQVQSAKPGRHCDGKGLYLLVKPSGSKSWVLRTQHLGRRRDFGLGSVVLERIAVSDSLVPLHRRRSLTLAEAREKARIGREMAKTGVNPSVEWRAEEAVVPTFEATAREYHGHVQKAWRNGKHGDQWLTTLETYVFPKLGSRLVSDIDADLIQSVLLPIWLTKSETARRIRQRIGVVLDYAHGKGWRETEAPMRAVGKLLGGMKQPDKGNFEAMPWSDLPAFMAKLREAESSMGRLALQFLILTAARSGEVRGATWAEIDLDQAEWRIAGSRMKAGKPHLVPLTAPALTILRKVQGWAKGNARTPLFPGLKGKPLSDATLNKALRVSGGFGTVHGLRSSFRDWAAEQGFNNDWAEAALAHSVAGQEGKTVAAYKRTAYFDQRRDTLMPAWARFVLSDRVATASKLAKGVEGD